MKTVCNIILMAIAMMFTARMIGPIGCGASNSSLVQTDKDALVMRGVQEVCNLLRIVQGANFDKLDHIVFGKLFG